MTEDEFRARFNADRRANMLTWVGAGEVEGIAVGINSDTGEILLHRNDPILLEKASFIADGAAGLMEELRLSRTAKS